MATVVFTDGTGTATLTNSKPAPGNRFASWTPSQEPVGDTAFTMATGRRYMFVFRTDYFAAFDFVGIPRTDMAIMLRLQRHLLAGGEVTVNTGDASARTYTCSLGEDGDVSIELTDSGQLEYTMRFTKMLNSAQTSMLCIY